MERPNIQKERKSKALSGYWAILIQMAVLATAIACFISPKLDALGVALIFAFIFFFWGYVKVIAGEAKNIIFSGRYKSTLRTPGFYWVSPLASTRKVSIKSNTVQTGIIRATDKAGDQVEVEATAFWKVSDAYMSSFLLEDTQAFVMAQTRLALQQVTAQYNYAKANNPLAVTLQKGSTVINSVLEKDIQSRLLPMGIDIESAHILQVYQLPTSEKSQQEKMLMQYYFRLKHDSAIASVETAEKVIAKLHAKKLVAFSPEEKEKFARDFILAMINTEGKSPIKE